MINLLNSETIDKIAAGEVVEKPVNIVKELVENSIDAGAGAISVEIKGGGIELIRVTDNGCGIRPSDCSLAFTRHATSKLSTIADLDTLETLGFRGEALSSIAAVSKCELITKTKGALLGNRIIAEGGQILENSEIGAPEGTTIISRQLFYNIPARRKFLKSETAEGAQVFELMQKLALSHPEVSFQFISNRTTKLSTNGSGDVKDVIYRIFGKETYSSLLYVDYSTSGISITGYTAKPEYVYKQRNGELYFVNGRIVTSKTVRTAIEEVYRNYLMQHQFPFCVLFINVDPATIDVNVHPKKAEVKFDNDDRIITAVMDALNSAFKDKDLIPTVSLKEPVTGTDNRETEPGTADEEPATPEENRVPDPEPYANNSSFGKEDITQREEDLSGASPEPMDLRPSEKPAPAKESLRIPEPFETKRRDEASPAEKAPELVQPTLFDTKILSDAPLKKYRIIGQVFETYWLITLDDDLYIVDQHAAHEKINYERFVKFFNARENAPGQLMDPPMAVSVSPMEQVCLMRYLDVFTKLGFEIEDFGSGSVAIRAIPLDLYGFDSEDLFLSLLDDLMSKEGVFPPTAVMSKLASMSCKAAIKGNMRFDAIEMENLMQELMKLDNPYNCPHGRPVFIRITKGELEKKFKRIV